MLTVNALDLDILKTLMTLFLLVNQQKLSMAIIKITADNYRR